MLNVVVFTFNVFEENTYLLSNEKNECWIIDPGMNEKEEEDFFLDYIRDKNLIPKGIINTHAHLDHIFGLQLLIDKFHIPFSIHQEELPVLQSASQIALMFGFKMTDAPPPSSFIAEKTPLMLGDDRIDVFFTPGHSTGSISFYYPAGHWVISGDVLFSGSIGRTDLPGGDFDTLIQSIKTQLFTLPGDTKVLPGHGPATTIKHEILHNPFLK